MRRHRRVVAGQPDQPVAAECPQPRRPGQVAAGILDRRHQPGLEQAGDRFVGDSDADPSRNVVDDDRATGGVGQRGRMGEHAGLGRMAIRRGRAEQRRRTIAGRLNREDARGLGCQGTAGGDDGDASVRRLDRHGNDAAVFGDGQRRTLAGAAGHDQGRRAVLDLAHAQPTECLDIDLARAERRDHGDKGAPQVG